MKSPVHPRPLDATAGTVGTARVAHRTHDLLRRLRPGDVAVLEHLDMDRGTAQALVDAGVVAVVDAAAIISGRYPNLGPRTLVEAGVVVVDGLGPAVLAKIADGVQVRVHEGAVYLGEVLVGAGRPLDAASVTAAMESARQGLTAQLAAFTHNASELLRREEDLLLHGRGVPRLTTRLADRPVVVASGGLDRDDELAGLRVYLREQHPVLVGVGRAADALRAAGLRVDVVVVDATEELPSAAVLRAARDVVVRSDGPEPPVLEQIERLGVRPVVVQTAVAAEDAALVVADAADPALIVTLGLRGTIEALLDTQRPAPAGAFLARLKAGPRLVDAAAVPRLYAGRVRPWHLLLVMLAGLAALAAAVAVTPVGQEWADATVAALADLSDTIEGLFS